jgi:hypothetical protein
VVSNNFTSPTQPYQMGLINYHKAYYWRLFLSYTDLFFYCYLFI